jgi:hypothetical protein
MYVYIPVVLFTVYTETGWINWAVYLVILVL